MDNDPVIKQYFADGCPKGPVSWQVKSWILRKYGQQYNLDTLIETGTYDGKNLEFLAPYFREIHSIELSPEYYKLCCQKLEGFSHIRLHQGDSAKFLRTLLTTWVTRPCLVYLDAHFMGGDTAQGEEETPIVAELAALAHVRRPNVIVIDDVQEFIDNPAYPSVEWVEKTVQHDFPLHTLKQEGNEFILVPIKNLWPDWGV
jgi:hypothetical protein